MFLYTLKVIFCARKKGAFTAKVAELYVPMGWPLGPIVSAVSPHCITVLSAPAPSIVINALMGDILTFSLRDTKLKNIKKKKKKIFHSNQICRPDRRPVR